MGYFELENGYFALCPMPVTGFFMPLIIAVSIAESWRLQEEGVVDVIRLFGQESAVPVWIFKVAGNRLNGNMSFQGTAIHPSISRPLIVLNKCVY